VTVTCDGRTDRITVAIWAAGYTVLLALHCRPNIDRHGVSNYIDLDCGENVSNLVTTLQVKCKNARCEYLTIYIYDSLDMYTHARTRGCAGNYLQSASCTMLHISLYV